MFQLWLSRSTSASWEDFIDALKRSELPKVAKEVSEFYYGILHMNVHTCIYSYSTYVYIAKRCGGIVDST